MHLYDIYTLLGYNSPVEFPNWMEFISEEVGSFIESTEIQRNEGPDTCLSEIHYPFRTQTCLQLRFLSIFYAFVLQIRFTDRFCKTTHRTNPRFFSQFWIVSK